MTNTTTTTAAEIASLLAYRKTWLGCCKSTREAFAAERAAFASLGFRSSGTSAKVRSAVKGREACCAAEDMIRDMMRAAVKAATPEAREGYRAHVRAENGDEE